MPVPAVMLMAISVAVPKNLSSIKTKVAMNLAALLMVALMLPFFFLAMYEKDGFPAEKILYFMIRQKFLVPGIRPYKSENLYRQLEETERMKKEVYELEEKANGRKAGRT